MCVYVVQKVHTILSVAKFLKQENGSKYLIFSPNMYHLDKALMLLVEVVFSSFFFTEAVHYIYSFIDLLLNWCHPAIDYR